MIGDLFGMGVVSKVKQMLKLPGDLVRVLVEGLYRATLEEVTFEVPYFEVKVREVFEQHPRIDEPYVEALIRVTLDNFENYLALSQKLSSDMMPDAASFDDALLMSYPPSAVNDKTFSEYFKAKSCASNEPSDTPTICALSLFSTLRISEICRVVAVILSFDFPIPVKPCPNISKVII